MFRIQLNTDPGNPEPSNRPNEVNNIFEFSTQAVLIEGKLVIGSRAMAPGVASENTFSLKTMMIYCAGITAPKTMEKAPGGGPLLRAVADRKINQPMMMACLISHFEHLRDMALNRVCLLKATITEVILTYPNFLSGGEHTGDFRKFCHFYVDLIYGVWKAQRPCPSFELVSEGRAVALHVCEAFSVEDADCLFNRTAFFAELQDLVVGGSLNLKFFDGGGSTVVSPSSVLSEIFLAGPSAYKYLRTLRT